MRPISEGGPYQGESVTGKNRRETAKAKAQGKGNGKSSRKSEKHRKGADLKFGHYTGARHSERADMGRSMLRPYEDR